MTAGLAPPAVLLWREVGQLVRSATGLRSARRVRDLLTCAVVSFDGGDPVGTERHLLAAREEARRRDLLREAADRGAEVDTALAGTISTALAALARYREAETERST